MQGLAENNNGMLLWEEVLSLLKTRIAPQLFAAYIKPLSLSCCESPLEFLISAPSRLVSAQVEKNFSNHIKEVLAEKTLSSKERASSIVLKYHINVQNSKPSHSPYVVIKKKTETADVLGASSSLRLGSPINPKYTFSNFVVGNSNQFCHAAAMRVAEQPGASYNPLFIYGGVGLGKTHLLHAIGNAVLANNPKANVVYMSSETFTNDLIQALRTAKMEEFKNKMRSIEVLLIDDIQFMRNKERTQEEFFHTFNSLYNSKHQIVLTSDKLPTEIPGIEERLITRFSWGLTADLQTPDFETRSAILRKKAASEGFVLPEEVASWIAENISSNVRELEGALTRLHAISSLQNLPLTVERAQIALKPLLKPKTVNINIEDIKKAVATHFGIKGSEIISKRRTRNLSFPRQIAMYLCRKHTTASYPEIGAKFGGRDHSSVIHSASVVSDKLPADSELRAVIGEIEKKIFGESGE